MNRLLRRAAGSLLFIFFAAAGAQGSPTGKPQFFAAPPAVPKSTNAPGVKSQAKPVRLNRQELIRLTPQQEVQLTLPNGATYEVVFLQGTDHGGGMASWVGGLKGQERLYRVIVTNGPSGTFGSIDTPEGTFRIVPGERNDWLVDMTLEGPYLPASDLRNDERPVDVSPALDIDLSRATFVPGRNESAFLKSHILRSQIDLMFVVTRGLANRLGSSLATRLNFLVTQANDAYHLSAAHIELRMVHFTVVDYQDTGDNGDALDDITNNAGVFSAVEAVRAQFGADMVALLRDGGSLSGSGVAWAPSSPSAQYMYSVTTGCVTGCESVFIHEVGHNMGNYHDRSTAQFQSWRLIGGVYSSNFNAAATSYGYYFCKTGALNCNPALAPNAGGCSAQPECAAGDAANYSEIMAYFHASTDRLNRFSNPAQTECRGSQAGAEPLRTCGAANADTVSNMNTTRTAISALKVGLGALPGYVQFTASGHSATEPSGTMTFTVSRVGGSAGAISVDYAITNGTATAGSDFTAANGTLSWENGETANKTFSVAITNDALAEGAESFIATLSNLSGAPGVFLGYPANALGLIIEDFGGAAGGALPTGFASTDWTVANDQFNDGTTSLRSANALAATNCCDNDPGTSDLTYTGNLSPGVIAFAYRVSSYEGLGNLEFSVNGVTVLTATGETGWRFFSHPLAAGGNHTLRWRYSNHLHFRCNLTGPPGGPSCADRVWIDSVSLPGTAPVFHTLTVTKAGTGGGTVTSAPAGISCGSTCTFDFLSGTAVTLTAAAAGGSVFAGWSGAGCNGTGTCPVTVSTAAGVTATFTTAAGTPTGLAAPANVNFGGQSMQTTSAATTVTLTNIGTGTLAISAVGVSNANYAQTNNCTSLALSESCTATLTFTPGAEGAIPGDLTFTTSAGPVTVPLTGTGERSLVTHYYRAILNRAPDGPGKTFWENEAARLSALGVNINETWYVMAGYFFNSAEYLAANKTNEQFVADLYNTFFNRPPDAGGQGYWVGQIVSGLPREVVLFSFMFSNEFRTFTEGIFGNTAARPEVDMVVDFFRGLLNRLPDTASFNYWLGQLRTAQCAGAGPVYTAVDQISAAFMFNPEYDGRARSNTQFVTDMYYSFLRRGGDVGGVNYWINEINTSARFRNDVRYFGFLNSAEFGARVQAVIAAGCVP